MENNDNSGRYNRLNKKLQCQAKVHSFTFKLIKISDTCDRVRYSIPIVNSSIMILKAIFF